MFAERMIYMERTKKTPQERMIEEILSGIEKTNSAPWDNGRLNHFEIPISHASGKKYRGCNLINLFMANKLVGGFNEWATYNQVQNAGGQVKKGAHGTHVLFWSNWDKARKKYADDESNPDDCYWFARSNVVFDISQCEGELKPRRKTQQIEHPAHEEIDRMVAAFASSTSLELDLTKVSGSGFYSPSEHLVSVAALKYHKNADVFYSTLFHELVHSTAKALGRDIEGHLFGDNDYSKEEIVAECGALLMCMEFGFTKNGERDNSVAYLKSWSKTLRENPKWLFEGMSAAEKAVDFIFKKMGYSPRLLAA